MGSSLNMGNNHWSETIFAGLCTLFVLWLVTLQKICHHSANPYTPFLFNPILDIFMKPVISHNIHHASPNTNFYTIPYHHLWMGYENDLNKYNHFYKTKINFDRIFF